jgi:hypothetical protein
MSLNSHPPTGYNSYIQIKISYIKEDPLSADSICGFSTRGLPRPEKEFGKLKK